MDSEQKQAEFRFDYNRPSLDWYDIVKVVIKPADYCYFRIELRYGHTWWLIGKNPPAKLGKDYKWEETQIGQIYDHDLARFIEWAKGDLYGNKITEIRAISGELDIWEEIAKLQRRYPYGKRTERPTMGCVQPIEEQS